MRSQTRLWELEVANLCTYKGLRKRRRASAFFGCDATRNHQKNKKDQEEASRQVKDAEVLCGAVLLIFTVHELGSSTYRDVKVFGIKATLSSGYGEWETRYYERGSG